MIVNLLSTLNKFYCQPVCSLPDLIEKEKHLSFLLQFYNGFCHAEAEIPEIHGIAGMPC